MLVGGWRSALAGAATLGMVALGCGNKGGGSAGGTGSVAGPSAGGSAGPVAASVAEWRVGAYLSLSGDDADFGIFTKEGVELAVDEINKAGGVKTRPLKVLYEDDKSNSLEANNKVLQLIDRDKVVALIGEVTSSRSKAGGIVANSKHIPMITPTATNPDVTRVGPFVFRVCFTDDIQAAATATFLVDKLGKKRIALLYATDELYSSGLAEQVRKELAKHGTTMVAEKGFLKKETNFTTYLNELKDAKPDIIYAPIFYNQMALIARQAKALGLKGEMFVGGDGWDGPELLTDAGDELEGAYFTNFYAPDVPVAERQGLPRQLHRALQEGPVEQRRHGLRRGQASSPTPSAAPRTSRRTPSARRSRTPGTSRAPRAHHHRRRSQRRQAGDRGADQGEEVHLLLHRARQGAGPARGPRVQRGAPREVEYRRAMLLFWKVWSALETGLAQGAMIALVALGYTMVYGILKLINFAHSEVFMMGAYAGLFLIGALGGEGAPHLRRHRRHLRRHAPRRRAGRGGGAHRLRARSAPAAASRPTRASPRW